jgi:hypothetical protein
VRYDLSSSLWNLLYLTLIKIWNRKILNK